MKRVIKAYKFYDIDEPTFQEDIEELADGLKRIGYQTKVTPDGIVVIQNGVEVLLRNEFIDGMNIDRAYTIIRRYLGECL